MAEAVHKNYIEHLKHSTATLSAVQPSMSVSVGAMQPAAHTSVTLSPQDHMNAAHKALGLPPMTLVGGQIHAQTDSEYMDNALY